MPASPSGCWMTWTPACPGGLPPTGPAICPRNAGPWRRRCAPGSCWGFPARRPWNWGSTFPGSTPCWWRVGRAPGHPCSNRLDVPDAPGRMRWRRLSPVTTRWIRIWCTTRRRSSTCRSRQPSSIPPIPMCWARTCVRRRPRCRSPMTDLAIFPANTPALLDRLVADGYLRRRPAGWFWTHPQSAAAMVNLRADGGGPINIIDADTGALLGTMDSPQSHYQAHQGAVYVHQGEPYVVGGTQRTGPLCDGAPRQSRLLHDGSRRHPDRRTGIPPARSVGPGGDALW